MISNCKQIKLFGVILENKSEFDRQLSKIEQDIFKPIFEASGNKKYNLWYDRSDSDWSYICRKYTNEYLTTDLLGNFRFVEKASENPKVLLLELVTGFVGGGECYRSAFAYYVLSDLYMLGKYFNLRDLSSWEFGSGINCPAWKSNIVEFSELGAFVHSRYHNGAHYTRPWIMSTKRGLQTSEEDWVARVCEYHKISDLRSVTPPGLWQYIDNLKKNDVRIPKSINNKMDLAIWKSAVGKIKITGKNIDKIMYWEDFTDSELLRLMIQYLYENHKRLFGYKYMDKYRHLFPGTS